jgi:hypothetical protein
MGMRVEDIGELAYGGLVVGARELDSGRMAKGKLTEKDILKKYETYAYLVPGVGATLMSAFGWMRRYETWAEHVSHGFIYAFPGFLVDTVRTMTGSTTSSAAKRAAVKEAQRILNANKALPPGMSAERSYQVEYDKVGAW